MSINTKFSAQPQSSLPVLICTGASHIPAKFPPVNQLLGCQKFAHARTYNRAESIEFDTFGDGAHTVLRLNTKPAWIICLVAVLITINIFGMVFHFEPALITPALFIISIALLIIAWDPRTHTYSCPTNNTQSAQSRLQPLNDAVLIKLENLGIEIDGIQNLIFIAIHKSIRNLTTATVTCENNKKIIIDIINKTKDCNILIFKKPGIWPINREFDALCNDIYITCENWLSIIDQISMQTKLLSQTFDITTSSLSQDKNNKSVQTCIDEISSFLETPHWFESDSMQTAMTTLKNFRVVMGQHESIIDKMCEVASPDFLDIYAITKAMETVARDLVKTSRIYEHDTTMFRKLCELFAQFEENSLTFNLRSENIKSRLNRLQKKSGKTNQTNMCLEQIELNEIIEINKMVSTL